MKLDIDCMRDILLLMETSDYLKKIRVETTYATLDYEHETIDYAILKLREAGFIEATIIEHDTGIILHSLNDITYDGHQFLESIRSDSVWEPTKKIASKIGSFTVSGISQVATGVLTQIIKSELGSL